MTPNLRAVCVEVSPAEIHAWVYYDGPLSEQEEEGFDGSVLTQLVADFPCPERGDPAVYGHFIQCAAPHPLDWRGTRVYARREPGPITRA